MLTSKEQREALEKAGWSLYEGFLPDEQWEKDGFYLYLATGGSVTLDHVSGRKIPLQKSVDIAAILGISPPGMVMVPVEVAQNAIRVCDMHVNLAKNVFHLDVAPLVKGTREAIVQALNGGDTHG